MRKILILAFLMLAATGFAKAPQMLEFVSTEHDFGTVSESAAPFVVEYEFENVADVPVAVLSVSAACGCTKPEYPVRPLRPGEKGVIKVTFTPDGQVGEVNKDIKVRFQRAKAPASKSLVLRLRGVVTPK